MPDHRPAESTRGATRSALDVARLAALPPRVLSGLIVALAALVMLAELPGRPLILHALQKLAHPVVFGAIAIGLLAIEYQRAPAARALPTQYLRAFAIATLFGALTEIAQLFTHRDPSLRDVWLDARGAAAALAFAMTFDARWRGVLSRGWRAASVAAGIALGALILTPLSWSLAGYARRSLDYPVLFTPGSALNLLFVSLTAGSPELARAPAILARAPQEMALRVPLQARPYAGVTLDEPSPDWTGYDTLAVDVGNAGRNDLALHVTIHDRTHDWTVTDRFNAQLQLVPGERKTVEFPLAEIRLAANGRTLDLKHIAGMALYRSGPEGPREFWLFRVELRRQGKQRDGLIRRDPPAAVREGATPCAEPVASHCSGAQDAAPR